MKRKDTIANKTLGESLLFFVTSVALGTNAKFSAQKRVLQDVATHIHTTLFNKEYSDIDGALILAERFSGMSDDTTINWNSHDFLRACATLCTEYYEIVHHIYNKEVDNLPF